MYCLDFCFFVSRQKIEPILTSFKIVVAWRVKAIIALCCQDFQLALKQAFESFLNKVCCKLLGWKKRDFIAFLAR